MATAKKRINISLAKDTENALKRIAIRDQVPIATKAEEMMRFGLEIEEDVALGTIAAARDTRKAKYVTAKEVWQ